MAEKNPLKEKLSKEQLEILKKVVNYKINCEANIVSCFYKKPDELYNYNLTNADFSNNIWRVYFQIAYDLVIVEHKSILNDITVGIYLEKHDKLREKFDEYGGYNTIQSATEYIVLENLNGYVQELRKWNSVVKLMLRGFPIKDDLSRLVDMTSEDIYQEYEAFLNDTFVNVDSDVKSYDICDNITELVDELDEGFAIGLPYYNLPILTKETGGQCKGYITLLGGLSNAGKSTVIRSATIPSIINTQEKLVIMVNEDSLKKWQREMLVWICNNIFHFDIQKHTVRDGSYTSEVKENLYKAADWLKEKTKNHLITIIPFQQYKTSKAIKSIKKYAAMGVKYFMLDTFKMDAGEVNNNSWTAMQQSMVDIKDTIKAEALNVHILITFQLEKGSSVMRYYTQNNIGIAKNIVDVASTCIMIRDVFEDEYTDEKRALKVYRLEGENGKTKIQVKLAKDKKYQVFFIVKNQEGSANTYQIVVHHDKSRNILEEVGITNIMPDNF